MCSQLHTRARRWRNRRGRQAADVEAMKPSAKRDLAAAALRVTWDKRGAQVQDGNGRRANMAQI
eukprot:CAMPEP_0171113454 /NCGR_PEP_ID=MMETSP0766_2-20121228/82453_1 /TAXON_ID=439317 /ORGANISM="Gambierdiscus australes, Strain CAWD 149" /LENGTH=63 /DNA_ID=CAMNT_0011575659 /DNA_START=306 /DNA_END=494 /DNA_ORIENTATION=-